MSIKLYCKKSKRDVCPEVKEKDARKADAICPQCDTVLQSDIRIVSMPSVKVVRRGR